MKIFLMIFILLQSTLALSNNLSCGEYKISGTARTIKDTPFIIVNENTKSEYILAIPISEEPRLVPYVGRSFEFIGEISKKMDGTKGYVKNIKNITLRVPNPLSEKPDTGLKLFKELPCLKQ